MFLAGGATVVGLGMYFMNNRSQQSKMEHRAAETIEKTGDKVKESAQKATNKLQEGVEKGVEGIKKK
jgi:hypothetical protein